MASAKIATLLIRTLAKPISTQLKNQAKQHETFRTICVGLAQNMYKAEVKLRTNLLGETAKHVRPLSEAKAIDNGANALAEGFLFTVAALLIIGETWRSSRNQTKRRGNVDDQLTELQTKLDILSQKVDSVAVDFDTRWSEQNERNDELTRILTRVVEIGLRGGWAEFEGTPLILPKIQLAPTHHPLSMVDSRSDGQQPSTSTSSSQAPVPPTHIAKQDTHP